MTKLVQVNGYNKSQFHIVFDSSVFHCDQTSPYIIESVPEVKRGLHAVIL